MKERKHDFIIKLNTRHMKALMIQLLWCVEFKGKRMNRASIAFISFPLNTHPILRSIR